MAKTKYTRAQKQAYYSGMGYSTAYHGNKIIFDNPKNKESFDAGWKAGKAKVAKSPDKYPPLGTTKKKSGGKKSSAKKQN